MSRTDRCHVPTSGSLRKPLILIGFLLTAIFPASSQSQPHHPPTVQSGSISLGPGVTIFESFDEPNPIQQATEDLANDFQKVLGAKPRIVHHEQDAAPVTIAIGQQSKLPETLRPGESGAPESFSISVRTSNWKQGQPSKIVVLSGPDVRGTIYAIYQFSENYLGVDPMYYWTDHDPAKRRSVEIPAAFKQAFPAPVFKYRGFFINDEDLLTGWAPGEKRDKTGISLDVWNRIFETILRLKGNIVTPGTWIFPDEPQIRLASKRGLIVSQHHAIPLGLNVARWPKDVTYNYSTHPEILERAWKNAVNAYLPDQEVLWTVGLRGLSDVTYASMDPSVRDDNKALGQLISKAIADQIGIVRSVRPDAKFITNLWQEGARLVQQGFLTIPPDVSTVWADDGYGYIQDKGQVAGGQGAYDHVAMMNGRANQLTEMVPVERAYSELGRYIKAGATQYLLLNTSDIRPVTMTTKAVMDAVWKGLPSDSAQASADYYKEWATREFGEKAAAKIVDLYKDYFAAPAHFGDPQHEYGDQLYHTETRRLLLTYMIDSPLFAIGGQSPKWQPPRVLEFGFPGSAPMARKEWLQQTTTREIQQCGDAQPRWDAVWKRAMEIEPLVDPSRRAFYRSAILTMVTINRESSRTLLLVSKALQDADNGKMAEAHEAAEQALKALAEVQRAQSSAEYGKWKDWYRGDWLTGVYRTRQIVQVFSNYLQDPETHLAPPLIWDGWEAYYHIMHYEGDRSADIN